MVNVDYSGGQPVKQYTKVTDSVILTPLEEINSQDGIYTLNNITFSRRLSANDTAGFYDDNSQISYTAEKDKDNIFKFFAVNKQNKIYTALPPFSASEIYKGFSSDAKTNITGFDIINNNLAYLSFSVDNKPFSAKFSDYKWQLINDFTQYENLNSVKSIRFINENIGFLISDDDGLSTGVLCTSNGGESWEKVDFSAVLKGFKHSISSIVSMEINGSAVEFHCFADGADYENLSVISVDYGKNWQYIFYENRSDSKWNITDPESEFCKINMKSLISQRGKLVNSLSVMDENGNIQHGKNGIDLEKIETMYLFGLPAYETVLDTKSIVSPDNSDLKLDESAYTWPVSQGRISRGFMGQYPQHNGIDIASPAGTPIYAAKGGVVIKAEYSSTGYGNHLVIQHEDGYFTLYAHCKEISVSVGDEVKIGQLIATVGATGNATGNALHFEIYKNDVRYNPFDFIS